MAAAQFQDLCASVCATFGVPAPVLQPDPLGLLAFTLRIKDVDVSIACTQQASAPAAVVLVDFGAVPADLEDAVWPSLLEANFLMLGEHAPSFSRNPLNGAILLHYACPLEDTSATGLAQSAVRMADLALGWRKHLRDVVPPNLSPLFA